MTAYLVRKTLEFREVPGLTPDLKVAEFTNTVDGKTIHVYSPGEGRSIIMAGEIDGIGQIEIESNDPTITYNVVSDLIGGGIADTLIGAAKEMGNAIADKVSSWGSETDEEDDEEDGDEGGGATVTCVPDVKVTPLPNGGFRVDAGYKCTYG